MENTRKSQCGKTSPVHLAPTRGGTSQESSKNSVKSATPTLMFLDRRAVNGEKPVCTWEITSRWPGGSSTLNFGESPNDASVSSLSSILEDNVPEKYFLSERACQGILRRSEERGKPLPELLVIALRNTIAVMRWKTMLRTSEFPWQEITLFKPSQDEWVQGGGNVPLVVVPQGFPNQSYAEFEQEDVSSTLRASGGVSGGGNRDIDRCPVICRASGQANAEVLENMAPTLHTLCDHPFVAVPICLATAQGNAEITEGIAPTITAAAGMSGNNQPMVTVPVVMGG